MATFLLVHGAWHGAWCWERLLPALAARGHHGVAIDLPDHGGDRGSPWSATLAHYAGRVRESAAALREPPVLLGHSMGGIVISQAATEGPGEFAALVYLCAFVPERGESLASLGRLDPSSLVPKSARLGLTGPRIRADRAKNVFYGSCSDEDARWASARLQVDPWLPLVQGFRPRHPIRVPRVYVECTQDRAISLDRQRAMRARFDFERVVTLDTDHSPFLSRPDELAAHLADIGRFVDGSGRAGLTQP